MVRNIGFEKTNTQSLSLAHCRRTTYQRVFAHEPARVGAAPSRYADSRWWLLFSGKPDLRRGGRLLACAPKRACLDVDDQARSVPATVGHEPVERHWVLCALNGDGADLGRMLSAQTLGLVAGCRHLHPQWFGGCDATAGR